jgi:DNA-binding protein H-NS
MSEPFIIDVIDNKRKKLAEAVKDIIIRDAQEKLLKAKKTLEESGINPNDLLNDDTQKS